MADASMPGGMGEIVNLRRARKAKVRAAAAGAAAEQRARFGRTKAERAGDAAEPARVARVVDGAFVGDGAGD